MKKSRNFYLWLAKQAGRDDIVGDLASDVIRADFSDIGNTKKDWLNYFNSKRVPHIVLEAFEQAWNEFDTL